MRDRLTRVHRKLQKQNLDALLVSSIPNITYLTGFSNFSIEEREAYLLITKTHAYIFTDPRYSKAVEKMLLFVH